MDAKLAYDFAVMFSTESGKRVLKHLRESIYDCIYEGSDPLLLAAHNARRSVVHEMLFNIDMGEHPERYLVGVETSEGIING